MKTEFWIIAILLLLGCQNSTNSNDQKIKANDDQKTSKEAVQRPKVSFTFDDGITNDIGPFKFEDWNNQILSALNDAEVKAVFFVTGSNKTDTKGQYLLNSWTKKGHKIANHTYSHPNFNSAENTVNDFEKELIQTDRIISAYDSYTKLFRFPYLKEGENEEKINGFRKVLAKHGYHNGHVSIDASDWYINSQLIKSIRKDGVSNPNVEKYKDFYLQHILDRADYYEDLSFQITSRHINHTLLLHHNLSSALFLDDLIEKFKEEGWEIMDADKAFQDQIFQKVPTTVPAGESIIWSLAKESGKYEDSLRYPAEDSRYEIPKMQKLGL